VGDERDDGPADEVDVFDAAFRLVKSFTLAERDRRQMREQAVIFFTRQSGEYFILGRRTALGMSHLLRSRSRV
jgi:hypothetical protein